MQRPVCACPHAGVLRIFLPVPQRQRSHRWPRGSAGAEVVALGICFLRRGAVGWCCRLRLRPRARRLWWSSRISLARALNAGEGIAVSSAERTVSGHEESLDSPLCIGQLTLKNRLILAPMESGSDCAYRRMCFEQGAGFTFTEMVRPAAIIRRNKSTFKRIDTFDPETPTSLQLLGSGPREVRRALETIEELAARPAAEGGYPHWAQGIHGVDLNFGCPSVNVIRDGKGPALLNRVQLLGEIFEELARWRSKTWLPIGVIGAKIRLGLTADDERRGVYLRAVRLAKGQLDYVAVHGRHTGEDSKTSKARWDTIRKAKEAAGKHLKIFGNGDIFTRADAERMLLQTGCDGVLVARGAIRTAGLVFDSRSQGDDAAAAEACDVLEGRYAELSKRFGGSRPKLADYHQEAFRQIRARGLRSVLNNKWQDIHRWLEQHHQDTTEGVDQVVDLEKITEYFSPDAQINFSSWCPRIEIVYADADGVASFIPLLARALCEGHNRIHIPMEDAEDDPRQIFIGMANTCTATLLFGDDDRIVRVNMLCASCGIEGNTFVKAESMG